MLKLIDLRSDTVTRPTPEMLASMLAAPVGDDVFAEDPTVNQLQERAAGMFGKEAALFCPSGTMANQIAINVHTRPGDEVICADVAHVYLYEGGGMARNSGVQAHLVPGNRGRITATEVEHAIRPADSHFARTSLVCLEDTVNKGGGAVYARAEVHKIKAICSQNDLSLHLDGARLFNALVQSGQNCIDYALPFDSISICLSKGLGAPVGSLILGDKTFIAESHRVRKVLGGGMRQAGFLAAAGLYALDHHIDRLREDHSRALTLAKGLEECSYVDDILSPETNIVIFKLGKGLSAIDMVADFKAKGLLCAAFGPYQIRFVTHLDFQDDELNDALRILRSMRY